MITNLQNNSPNFTASVSEGFKKAAHNYFHGVEYRPQKVKIFDEKVNKVINHYGYDEYTITFDKTRKEGKTFYNLYAESDLYKVPLTSKDQFRKVLQKFLLMTKGELYIKIKQFKEANKMVK